MRDGKESVCHGIPRRRAEGAPSPPSPVWHSNPMDRICVGRLRRLAIHVFSG